MADLEDMKLPKIEGLEDIEQSALENDYAAEYQKELEKRFAEEAAATEEDTSEAETEEATEEKQSKQPEIEDSEEADTEEVSRRFQNVGEFVEHQIARTISRKINNKEFCWCSEWWKHPEALQRFEQLWNSWEEARLTPGKPMLEWWWDFDYHFNALTVSTGTFRYCEDGKHNKARLQKDYLPIAETPPGFFDKLSNGQ